MFIRSSTILSAKCEKSLQNTAGFWPFQLVLERNYNFTSTLSDHSPALSMKPRSEILQDNLNAQCSARWSAFISSEKMTTSSHNVRTSEQVKHVTGDQTFYKREDNEFRGPGFVIGQLNQ